jgi:glycosyltransferase involved in cell wall biosynthesis
LELDPGRDLFFSYTTNCLETLGWLRERGVFTVVDQVDPARVEEDLVIEEAERWPGWIKAPGRLPQAYWDRLKAEWDLADVVLVNSEWSAEALVRQGVRREKIIVAPLAVHLPPDRPAQPIIAEGTLKVLWLGSVVLRKGIQYLVEAARRLQGADVQFLVAGPLYIDDSVVATFPSNIKVLGRVTRDQLGEVYNRGAGAGPPAVAGNVFPGAEDRAQLRCALKRPADPARDPGTTGQAGKKTLIGHA